MLPEIGDITPKPSDPPFLFTILLAARKSKDEMLEDLANGWLAEQGISVRFADNLKSRKPFEVMARG